MEPVQDLLRDVRDFLGGLRRELPELFRAPARAPLPARDEAVFEERARHWAPKLGVSFKRVRVKDLRSLWGSCSRLGNLNFNRRLLSAPPEVLDYVVIHELAHLLEMNHSSRFWRHVAAWCPEHRERRRWLREQGPALLRRR